MSIKPQPNDRVIVTIKDNNQIINGIIKSIGGKTTVGNLCELHCSIELEDPIKIHPATEALINFGDNINRQSIIKNYNQNTNILKITGIDMNK